MKILKKRVSKISWYTEIKNYPLAREAFQKVTEKFSQMAPLAYFYIGRTYWHEKNYPQAIEEFQNIISASEQPGYNDEGAMNTQAYYWIGRSQEELKEWDKAAQKGAVHKKTSSRKKSRLSKKIASLSK